jgi:antitoxin (DNA-binding transcriptional repressor) of toxin-antitoxin stability system
METVKIREIRGAALREKVRDGKPLAITNRGALIGVIIPVTRDWVEHLIDYNWSQARQSIAEGEQAMASGSLMLTVDDVVAQASTRGPDDGPVHGTPERLAPPLVAAMVGGAVIQPPEGREALQRLQALLNPSSGESPADPSVLTVRIGDLSAKLIEQAGAGGHTVALTHDRELVGVVIPVTQGLVEFLIEENMSRVLYNIALGEKQLMTPDKMTTLDEVIEHGGPRPADQAPPPVKRAQEAGARPVPGS